MFEGVTVDIVVGPFEVELVEIVTVALVVEFDVDPAMVGALVVKVVEFARVKRLAVLVELITAKINVTHS